VVLLPPDMEDTEIGAPRDGSAMEAAAATGRTSGGISANFRDNMGPVAGICVFGAQT